MRHPCFQSQGNDFDLFMLFCANFMLNGCREALNIHPWVHSLCNNVSHDDALAAVSVPETWPQVRTCYDVVCLLMTNISLVPLMRQEILEKAEPEHRDFSMVAGEFLMAYSEQVSFI